jgi:hypothetical protein
MLVFDYAGPWSLNLAITNINVNGATVTGAGGQSIDLADSKTLLPFVVESVAASQTGEADAGQTVHLTLQMSDAVNGPFNPTLTLNDGATATYDSALSQPSSGTLVFDYTVQAGDHTPNLEITGVSALQNTAGDNADVTGALNVPTGLRIGPALYAASATPSAGEGDAGSTVKLTLNMNQAVTIDTSGGAPTLTLSDLATATYDAAASNPASGALVFDYAVGTNDHSPNLEITSVNTNGAVITDAGNDTPSFTDVVNAPTGLQIGPSPLTVTSVQASPAGDSGLNQTITLTLTMSENVTVTKGLVLTLNDGDVALYNSTSGDQMTFVTQVEAGDESGNLEITGVFIDAGGSVQDSNGYNADFSNAINAPTGVQVEDPLDVVSVTTDATSGEVLAGQTVKITLNMSEGFTIDTSGGSPTLLLSDGATATYDATASNPSTGALVFDYAVGASDQAPVLDIAKVLLNGATITDAHSNPANFTNAVEAIMAFQVGPTGVIDVSTSQIGTIHTNQTIEFMLTMNQNVVVDTSGGAPTLTLSDNATATYDAAATATFAADPGSAGALVFDYQVGAGDLATDLEISRFNLSGATITDLDGTAAVFSGALDQFSGVSVNEAPCYCRGTLIRTDRGDKRVEKLKIGDKVMTKSGAPRPIKWIGKRSYGGRFIMGRKDILPICIRAGALDDNVPRRDLWISPHHAMYLEGALVEAKDLVNGVSVVRAEQIRTVEYFHVELDSHDVIIADGALSESFVDDDSRGMFHNAHEYRSLYPEAPLQPALYCAPRLEEGYQVDAARRHIALRAGLLRAADPPRIGQLRGYVDLISASRVEGWAQNAENPEAPVCLDIYAGGRLIGQTLANRYREDLAQAGLGSGRHSFAFSAPVGLSFAAAEVEVRRSLDGAALELFANAARALPRAAIAAEKPARSSAAETPRPNIAVYRRASSG